MVGSGRTLSKDFGLQLFRADGVSLPMKKYQFDEGGRPLFVYFCVWDDNDRPLAPTHSLPLSDRLRVAFAARRTLGQQTLELIVSGYSTADQADAAIQQRLPDLLRIENQNLAH
jgi:hypothetical protein